MTPLPLASAENWTLCDPHDLFLERAVGVTPGTERAFIEAQINAFSDRAYWLEGESRCWHGDAVPVREGEKPDRGEMNPLADFAGERTALPRLCPGAGERTSVAGPGGRPQEVFWRQRRPLITLSYHRVTKERRNELADRTQQGAGGARA